jgi:hypothetical protein
VHTCTCARTHMHTHVRACTHTQCLALILWQATPWKAEISCVSRTKPTKRHVNSVHRWTNGEKEKRKKTITSSFHEPLNVAAYCQSSHFNQILAFLLWTIPTGSSLHRLVIWTKNYVTGTFCLVTPCYSPTYARYGQNIGKQPWQTQANVLICFSISNIDG